MAERKEEPATLVLPDPGKGGVSVCVIVRAKPPDPKSRHLSVKMTRTSTTIQMSTRRSLDGKNRNPARTFNFDRCYWSVDPADDGFASQETVFAELGPHVLLNTWRGFNTSIFAYGQTGSGKSYTMMGNTSKDGDAGFIPRLCGALFTEMAGKLTAGAAAAEAASEEDTEEVMITVEASYLEIYNERVKDLLDLKSSRGVPGRGVGGVLAAGLKVREHPDTGPWVEGLSTHAVNSYADVARLLDAGNLCRSVAATNMNQHSSRSHAIFQLVVTQTTLNRTKQKAVDRVSRVSLVDLAGSERATKAGEIGDRLVEAQSINKSLTMLGLVISTLAKRMKKGGRGEDTFVPYRNAVLTWLLKDSLGGNSVTCMIATLNPAMEQSEESLSTLRYADQAKKIVNKAVVNEDDNTKLVAALKSEVEDLRRILAEKQAALGIVPAPETRVERVEVEVYKDNPELQAEIAALRIQNTLRSKLMSRLHDQWAKRLETTAEAAADREAALKSMGVQGPGGFSSMSLGGTAEDPDKDGIPYLTTLHSDPQLSGRVQYKLHPGALTVGSGADCDIQLGGIYVLDLHCTLHCEQEVAPAAGAGKGDDWEGLGGWYVYVEPAPGASVYVNGVEVGGKARPAGTRTLLSQSARVVLGITHYLRYRNPRDATEDPKHDWQFANEEVLSAMSKAHGGRPFVPGGDVDGLTPLKIGDEEESIMVPEEVANEMQRLASMIDTNKLQAEEAERKHREAQERLSEAAEREASARAKAEGDLQAKVAAEQELQAALMRSMEERAAAQDDIRRQLEDATTEAAARARLEAELAAKLAAEEELRGRLDSAAADREALAAAIAKHTEEAAAEAEARRKVEAELQAQREAELALRQQLESTVRDRETLTSTMAENATAAEREREERAKLEAELAAQRQAEAELKAQLDSVATEKQRLAEEVAKQEEAAAAEAAERERVHQDLLQQREREEAVRAQLAAAEVEGNRLAEEMRATSAAEAEARARVEAELEEQRAKEAALKADLDNTVAERERLADTAAQQAAAAAADAAHRAQLEADLAEQRAAEEAALAQLEAAAVESRQLADDLEKKSEEAAAEAEARARVEAELDTKLQLEKELKLELESAAAEQAALHAEIEAKAEEVRRLLDREAEQSRELEAQRAAEDELRTMLAASDQAKEELAKVSAQRAATLEDEAKRRVEVEAQLAEQRRAHSEVEARLAAAEQERAALAFAAEKDRIQFERAARTQWRAADRLRLLAVQLQAAMPLVAEANAMARALGKPVQVALRLVPTSGMHCVLKGDEGAQWERTVDEDELYSRFDRQVGASVTNVLTASTHLWSFEVLQNRVDIMQTMCQQALRGDLQPPTTEAALMDDPFYDPPVPTLVGRAAVQLDALLTTPHAATATVPVANDRGRVVAQLDVAAKLSSPPDPGSTASLSIAPRRLHAVADGKAGLAVVRWPSWDLQSVRTLQAVQGGVADGSAAFNTPGFEAPLSFGPDTLARFKAGGEVEFDVYMCRSESDAVAFLKRPATPTSLPEATADRAVLLKFLQHPERGGHRAFPSIGDTPSFPLHGVEVSEAALTPRASPAPSVESTPHKDLTFSTRLFVGVDVYVEVHAESDAAVEAGKAAAGKEGGGGAAGAGASATAPPTGLDARPGFVFVPATVKRERAPPHGPVFLVPPGARRRLVLRVVQADRQPCVLESCKLVRLHPLTSTLPVGKTRGRSRSRSATKHDATEPPVLAMERDADRRVLKLLLEWGAEGEPTATARGERLTTTVDMQLYLQGVNSVVPVRRQVALKLEETGTLAALKRTLAATVRKRFEEGGANRAHLLGSSVEVAVSRGIAAPDRVLEGMVKAVSRVDGPSPAGGAGVVPGMRLVAPPPPRVKRPTATRRVSRPYASTAGVAAAAAAVPPPEPASVRGPTPPLAVPPPSASPAPLEDVAVRDAPPATKSGFLLVRSAAGDSRRWVAMEQPFLAAYKGPEDAAHRAKPKLVVSLSSFVVKKAANPLEFDLEFDDGVVWTLQASNQGEKRDWVRHLLARQ